jgi:hypothetical protein
VLLDVRLLFLFLLFSAFGSPLLCFDCQECHDYISPALRATTRYLLRFMDGLEGSWKRVDGSKRATAQANDSWTATITGMASWRLHVIWLSFSIFPS